jgi:TPP-dependent pyruvate/acetoin dehydrogenase alpha subunit
LTEAAWKKMDEEILQTIEDAVTFAKESPFPGLDTALEDVFAD